MHLDTPLSMQGTVTGDTLTLLVRHAKIHDPYAIQHFVAYQEDTSNTSLLHSGKFLPSQPGPKLSSATKASV